MSVVGCHGVAVDVEHVLMSLKLGAAPPSARHAEAAAEWLPEVAGATQAAWGGSWIFSYTPSTTEHVREGTHVLAKSCHQSPIRRMRRRLYALERGSPRQVM